MPIIVNNKKNVTARGLKAGSPIGFDEKGNVINTDTDVPLIPFAPTPVVLANKLLAVVNQHPEYLPVTMTIMIGDTEITLPYDIRPEDNNVQVTVVSALKGFQTRYDYFTLTYVDPTLNTLKASFIQPRGFCPQITIDKSGYVITDLDGNKITTPWFCMATEADPKQEQEAVIPILFRIASGQTSNTSSHLATSPMPGINLLYIGGGNTLCLPGPAAVVGQFGNSWKTWTRELKIITYAAMTVNNHTVYICGGNYNNTAVVGFQENEIGGILTAADDPVYFQVHLVEIE